MMTVINRTIRQKQSLLINDEVDVPEIQIHRLVRKVMSMAKGQLVLSS
jgi:hypothetical protein